MTIRLIKNENDYEKSLSRIEDIFDSKIGTSEYDELELLTTLVELYEEQQYPINPPDPIDAIKFRMEQLGLNQKDMIPFFGSKSKVSEVLNRKRNLTLSMMRALNKGVGLPAEVLLREPGKKFPISYMNLEWSKFPVSEMVKRNWIPHFENIKEKSEEIMRELINEIGGLENIPVSFFRQGEKGRYNPKMDKYSLAAWCLRVISLAQKTELKSKYNQRSINLITMKEVARLSYFNDGPKLAKEYLSKHGIHLLIVPHLPKTYLDGAAILLPNGTPVVALTLRYDRIDNFWFCLLHELAHVSLHLSVTDRFFVDDLDQRGKNIDSDNISEKEADDLANESLIPKKIWDKKPIQNENINASIKSLADKLKIHSAIIAGRIRYENNNYKLLSKHIGNKQIRKHFINMN